MPLAWHEGANQYCRVGARVLGSTLALVPPEPFGTAMARAYGAIAALKSSEGEWVSGRCSLHSILWHLPYLLWHPLCERGRGRYILPSSRGSGIIYQVIAAPQNVGLIHMALQVLSLNYPHSWHALALFIDLALSVSLRQQTSFSKIHIWEWHPDST